MFSLPQAMTDAIRMLKVRYTSWRAMHDDGNGFFRALFVGYLEGCVQNCDIDGIKYLGDRCGPLPCSIPKLQVYIVASQCRCIT